MTTASHAPAALYPPRKTWYPLCRRLGGAPGLVWTGAESLAPPWFDPRTVQLVASCYTDWATRPTKWLGHKGNFLPPPSAEVKNTWSRTSTLPIRLHCVHVSCTCTFPLALLSANQYIYIYVPLLTSCANHILESQIPYPFRAVVLQLCLVMSDVLAEEWTWG